jgi:hypothetical protein
MRTFGSAIFSAMFSRDSVLRFPMFYNSVLPDRSRCQSCAPRATPAWTCRSPACLQTGIVLHHRDRHVDHVGDDAVGETSLMQAVPRRPCNVVPSSAVIPFAASATFASLKKTLKSGTHQGQALLITRPA